MDYNVLLEASNKYQSVAPTLSSVMGGIRGTADRISSLQSSLSGCFAKKDLKKFYIELNNVTNVILNQASKQIRDVARVHFEKIVTDAIQFVTQDTSYKFVIEDSPQRNKPSYEFYIESMVNGQVSRQKPEDACGGGFIDIISVTAKYAYWQIFKNPEIKNACSLLDEPGKMVSEQMSVKFAEYIKFLGKHFNKQTIMITHNENLANVADKIFYVSKNRAGISTVSIPGSYLANVDDLIGNIPEVNEE